MTLDEAVASVPSPAYLIDLDRLERNARVLHQVEERTSARVLLALKGFATFSTFPRIRPYLSGVCASSVHESMLGHDDFGKEVHAYSPALSLREMKDLLPLVNHITFNSLAQWGMFQKVAADAGSDVKTGLRVNPEYSEVATPLYDPCAPMSRLGIRSEVLRNADLDGLSGLHFHTMCEQNSDTLERTVEALESRFNWLLEREQITWLNLGGGHHITREDYDMDRLCRVIDHVASKYEVQVYLEPGEAVALGSGYLVATVLDLVENVMPIAILDVSATAHMPDVLEMPYRPEIGGAGTSGEKAHTYRLGCVSCLAGDVIGDYSFEAPLEIGQRLVFMDMAHYTMVKTTTFNGVRLPSIALFDSSAPEVDVVREFTYEDYRNRLS